MEGGDEMDALAPNMMEDENLEGNPSNGAEEEEVSAMEGGQEEENDRMQDQEVSSSSATTADNGTASHEDRAMGGHGSSALSALPHPLSTLAASAAKSGENEQSTTTTTAALTAAAATQVGALTFLANIKDEEADSESFIPSGSDPKMKDAEKRVLVDKYDADAWKPLLSLAQNSSIIDARKIYDRFFKVFPMAGRYWKFYVDQEIAAGNNDMAARVFQSCLRSTPVVDLWRSYLHHVQKLHNPEENFGTIYQAYEFALEYLGHDMSATTIWVDYIAFLKHSLSICQSFDRGARISALRSAYRRAVVVPMHGLDRIWSEYELFEKELDTINNNGKEQLAPLISQFHAARTAYKERKRLREPVASNILPRPLPVHMRDTRLYQAWRRLIDWELSNVQRLDELQFKTRMTLTYNQCLLALFYYPEMWHEAAMFQLSSKDSIAAKEVFERALKSLPGSVLLRFAFAEFLESQNENTAAEREYEKMLEEEESPLVFIQYMRFTRRTKGVEDARRVFIRAKRSATCSFHVFIESANMELLSNRQPKIARKMFELAWNLYSSDAAFVLAYVEFLQQLNEETADTEIRVLFEKALEPKNGLNTEGQQLIWDRFLEFEISRGDLVAIRNVQKRRVAAFPDLTNTTKLTDLARRFSFRDLLPGTAPDLGISPTALSSVLLDTAKSLSAAAAGPPSISSSAGPPPHQQQQLQQSSAPPSSRPEMVPTRIPLPYHLQSFVQQLPPSHLITAELREGKILRLPDVDLVISTLLSTTIPDEYMKKISEGKRKKPAPPSYVNNSGNNGGGDKDQGDDDEPTVKNAPPVNDVYRARQQQKLAKIQQ